MVVTETESLDLDQVVRDLRIEEIASATSIEIEGVHHQGGQLDPASDLGRSFEQFKQNVRTLESQLRSAFSVTVRAFSTDRPCEGRPSAESYVAPDEVVVQFLPHVAGNSGGSIGGGEVGPGGSNDGAGPSNEHFEDEEFVPEQLGAGKRNVDRAPGGKNAKGKGKGKEAADHGEGDGKPASCCTFGEQPVVAVSAPTGVDVRFSANFGRVAVDTGFVATLTPAAAVFHRSGLCYTGVCQDEALEGWVTASLDVQFWVRASGKIKIGPIDLAGGTIEFRVAVRTNKTVDFTLKCGGKDG